MSVIALVLACPASVGGQTTKPTAEQAAFFETKIRPVLVEHCYQCHSAEAKKANKLKGDLHLDTRSGVLKGGENGPAIAPGKPAESLLLHALRYQGPKMPPKGKLPAAVIADFEKWIAMGAPDPRDGSAVAANTIDFTVARRHWAYQPIRRPELPAVKNHAWVSSPIDHFIAAKLEASGLSPSPPADRRTLIRRAYYDLIGLPPTGAEIETFGNDTSPDAFARVVDRLLASPHYGERWGRHWLDVARYADTKDGVLMYGDARIRPYAYTYRDYVVRAFNEDVPFDRFIHEQLAADQIEPKVEPWRLAAMGFLTLGRMFDNNVHDVIDDEIDTVTRGFLGLTVSCARCHDHKYDAIPTADYYSLYGVFASSEAPLELPLVEASLNPGQTEFEKQAAAKRQEVQKFLDSQYALLSETARQRVGDYLVHVATTKPDPLETAIFFLSLAPEDLRPPIVARWRRYLEQHARPDDPVFGPWHDLMTLSDGDFVAGVDGVRQRWQACAPGVGVGQVNPLVRDALAGAKLSSKADVARAYGQLLRRVYDESKKSPPAATDDARKQLLDILTSRDSPAYFPKSRTRRYMSRGETDSFGGKMSELDHMAVRASNAPPRAMVLVDASDLQDPRVFVRGNPAAPGERVSRRFLQVLGNAPPFAHGSGRLDLARAIAAFDNPLTSRVIVNRVWMYHLGQPLVQTPNDFGTRSTPPSHPDLLDYLAWRFQQHGWSLKNLHRLIMLSSAYQQASLDRPECRAVDAENRLLWRAHRRRLDLESMRDTMLTVSGRLDPRMGGRPVDVVNDALNRRRTVYGLVDRQSLPGLFRAFDFASPDQSAERRPFTTVPQQALFALNSPFMLEQAKALAARVELLAVPPGSDRVAILYRIALGRRPSSREAELAVSFITEAQSSAGERSRLTPWEQYAQVLLLTNEMMFLD